MWPTRPPGIWCAPCRSRHRAGDDAHRAEYGGCVIHVDKFAPQEGVLFLANEISRRKNDLKWLKQFEHDEASLKTLFEIAACSTGTRWHSCTRRRWQAT